MSSINHKGPKPSSTRFAPLNTRKTDQRVGQTYGERRERVKGEEAEKQLSLVQKAKDWFSSGKKQNNINEFVNKNDRFAGTQKNHFSSNPFVEHKSRLEEGLSLKSRVVQAPSNEYVQFLDSIIHYLTPPKKKV